MAAPTSIVAHHADSIDPTLLEWILHKIDSVLGLGPVAIVIVLALVMLAFPLGLAIMVLRRRRAS
jgi:hypothetical protein